MGQLYPLQSSTVERMYHIQIPGNVINRNWYRHITFDNSKPQLVAINILGEIVYRYKPIELRDAKSQGLVLKQQFGTEYLRHNYQYYMDLFGVGKHQAKAACRCLENLGVITLHWLNIINEQGIHYSNVMHIQLHVDKLIQISQPRSMDAPLDSSSMIVPEPNPDPDSSPILDQYQGGCAIQTAEGRDSNQGGCAIQTAEGRDSNQGGARIKPRRVAIQTEGMRDSNRVPPADQTADVYIDLLLDLVLRSDQDLLLDLHDNDDGLETHLPERNSFVLESYARTPMIARREALQKQATILIQQLEQQCHNAWSGHQQFMANLSEEQLWTLNSWLWLWHITHDDVDVYESLRAVDQYHNPWQDVAKPIGKIITQVNKGHAYDLHIDDSMALIDTICVHLDIYPPEYDEPDEQEALRSEAKPPLSNNQPEDPGWPSAPQARKTHLVAH